MEAAILDRISAAAATLSKSERLVAKAVLDDPALSSRENIADLARRAGVSQPTVFRFCRRFGCNGFPDFKQTLGATVDSGGADRRSPGVRSGDSVADIVRKVAAGYGTAIKDLQRSLDEAVLARCVDVVSQARRILICAQGPARAAAEAFRFQLLCLGMPCEICSDPQAMLASAASLRQEDLLVAVSLSGQERDGLSSVLAAARSGAFTICACPEGTPISSAAALAVHAGKAVRSDDDLLPNAVCAEAALRILSGGVSLRRAELVRQVRPKIRSALAPLGMAAGEEPPKEDDPAGALKPGEPITSLDWKL
ncbi:MAG: MurR/RpiR family transcriptional regulator [Succinivibrio sp.]